MLARSLTAAALLAGGGLAQPPGGPGGFGPPGMGGTRKVLKEFDTDGNGKLDLAERSKARESLKSRPQGGRRIGPPGGMGGGSPTTSPGPKVDPAGVTTYPTKPLYDPTVLRTLFLTFEEADWEQALEDFHGTDVEVPCTLKVDGKDYPQVGAHFRGMSSYMMVRAGQKRSLNLSLDYAFDKQRLYGAKTLNLLNAHEDPTFLSTVLYSAVSRPHLPTPKANLVKVVVNGESWGVYTSVQQFDKPFLKENFGTDSGTRWKVRGSPMGGGGLEYTGDDVERYKRQFEIKGKDDPKAWAALVRLCKTLNTTPPDQLEAALKPLLDLDGLLWFLAVDVGLINCDGYWARASDYSLYLDPKGKFHVVAHDMNECFRTPQGPGIGGGPGGPGGGFRMPRPGELLPGLLSDMLSLTDDQKTKLADLQKDTDGKLDALLTSDQRKRLKEMQSAGPMGGGGGFGGGGFGGGPGGFGGGGFGGPPGGGGRPGAGGGGGNLELDPLVGLTDARKPLRSKILAVPGLRAKYLANVREIADTQLDWKALGPVVAQLRALIEAEVKADTRKLETTEAFLRTTADDSTQPGRGHEYPLRAFADGRRKYLLAYQEKKEPAK